MACPMDGATQQTDGQKSKRGTSEASRANLTGGSRKGVPNKTTALLKDAIIEAATKAGGKDGLVGYLLKQAEEYPKGFLPLLGKVLPMQLTGDAGAPLILQISNTDEAL